MCTNFDDMIWLQDNIDDMGIFEDEESMMALQTDQPSSSINNNRDNHQTDTTNTNTTTNNNSSYVPTRNYYLTNERYAKEFSDRPLVLVDIQFVEYGVTEITIASPALPIVYHRQYAPQKAIDRRRWSHNMNYTGAINSESIRRNSSLMCDREFYRQLPSNAVVVVRGKNKMIAFKKIWAETHKSEPTIMTFPSKFRKSNRPKACRSHYKHTNNDEAVMCSVSNVQTMAKYYNIYTEMFQM